MSADIRATPTIHPIAWGALRPRDSSVDPVVQAVVLILCSSNPDISRQVCGRLAVKYLYLISYDSLVLENRVPATHPQMTQYPANPCQVQVLLSSGIGIRSRLHQKVFR